MHIIPYELFLLDRYIRNHKIVFKLFVLDKNEGVTEEVKADELDCEIVVSKFKFQLLYWTNTLRKCMKSL